MYSGPGGGRVYNSPAFTRLYFKTEVFHNPQNLADSLSGQTILERLILHTLNVWDRHISGESVKAKGAASGAGEFPKYFPAFVVAALNSALKRRQEARRAGNAPKSVQLQTIDFLLAVDDVSPKHGSKSDKL